jgi:hypothetical protein
MPQEFIPFDFVRPNELADLSLNFTQSRSESKFMKVPVIPLTFDPKIYRFHDNHDVFNTSIADAGFGIQMASPFGLDEKRFRGR